MEHTFVHYYDLSVLYREYDSLRNQYFIVKTTYENNSNFSLLENYVNMVQFIMSNIDNKIENINTHSNSSRYKRGLFNGVGSLLKGLTGNLDANDGERIEKILQHMKTNQMHLQEQIKMQYSVSNTVVKKFNQTLRDIRHNELALKSKIIHNEYLIRKGVEHENILFAKDTFNQLIILLNTILNILEEIENSLTFCKLQTLHPSIIKPKELFLELQKISANYKNQFPFEVKYENILDFESIIEIRCKVETNRINYLLSIPIDYEILFDLYYLLPIPTKHESEYLTIIPETKYVLKSGNNLVKPLIDRCTQGKIFHCPSHLLINFQSSCEKQVLIEEKTSHCRYNHLLIPENHIEIIPEIDQYLAVFSKEEEIKFKCQEQTETQTLIGIYLIKKSHCDVIFRNQRLNFLDKTYGKPLVMNKLPLDFNQANISDFRIELRTLKLGDIPLNPVLPIIEPDMGDYYKPSAWTIILYVCIACSAVYLYIRWKKIQVVKNQNRSQAIELQEQKVNLPEEARF